METCAPPAAVPMQPWSTQVTETDLFFGTSGPRDAPIVLVGESWGFEEFQQQKPFVGSSGQELDRMLLEAGINPASILKANVFNAQPEGNEAWRFFHSNSKTAPLYRGLHPSNFALSELQRLHSLIRTVKPRLVIAAGNYALWATAECCSTSSLSIGNGATVRVPGGITSWRGSMLESNTVEGKRAVRVLPIIHPASILRAWYQRAVTVHDLRIRVPSALQDMWRPTTPPVVLAPPDFADAVATLSRWLQHLQSNNLRLSHDIETARGLITCMSFADGPHCGPATALVIPFVRPAAGRWESYWTLEEEMELATLIRKILLHPHVLVEGQNYLYDTQYIQTFLGCTPRLDFDTMLAHHLLFPGTPKGLDYLSSLYCKYHWYWKEDLKEWDTHIDFEQNLRYNAEDALRTFECATALRALIHDNGMEELWEWEKKKAKLALTMMNRGIAIDRQHRMLLAFELSAALEERNTWLRSIIPQAWLAGRLKTSKSYWYSSPIQQRILFYDILGLKGQTSRTTGNPTVNFEALMELRRRNPELSRLFDCLIDCRSIHVYHDTFIQAPLEPDGRMKCSFNPAGTKTFRWSSSENAFRRGTNLQNLPIGEEE